LARVIPYSKLVNRGKMSNDGLSSYALSIGARSLAIIDSRMGNPSSISFLLPNGAKCTRYEFRITGVRLQREFREAKNDLPRKLFVVSKEGGDELNKLREMFSRFLDGEYVGKTNIGETQIESSEKELALKLEEKDQDIILRFIYLGSSKEIGPRITIRRSIHDTRSRRRIN
jgi:rRNA maturation protein Rpf1